MIEKHLSMLHSKHICVIGDVILDVFRIGHVQRVSQEAPVPILDIEEDNDCLGGALNVCNNILSLGASCDIIAVIGDDYEAFRLEYLTEKHKIKKSGLIRDRQRVTTCKTRLINGDEQLLRSDREHRHPVSGVIEKKLLQQIENILNHSDICILQDYNKGVLTPTLIKESIRLAKEKNIPVFVDPKIENIDSYAGAFLMKPNRKEAETILKYTISTTEEAEKASGDLLKKMQCENILLTLGADGMILRNKKQCIHIPALPLEIADITGAGDTVIAVLTALYSTDLPLETCAEFANRAAAKVCEQSGIVPATPNMLLEKTFTP